MNNCEPLSEQQEEKPEMRLPEIEEQIRRLTIEAARFGIHLRQEYSTMLWKDWHTEYLGFTFTLGGGGEAGCISLQITSKNHLLKQIDDSEKLNTIVKLEREAQKFVQELFLTFFKDAFESEACVANLLILGMRALPDSYKDQYYAFIAKELHETVILTRALALVDVYEPDRVLVNMIHNQLRKSG